MAKDNVECGFLTLGRRANKDVCYPIYGGDVVTIGSNDKDHIRIKGEFDNKTDAVLTACNDTGFVLVSNPEKCSTILNEKPLTKPQYLTPGDIIHIKNKFFTYNNDVLTNKEVDELILKNAGHIRTAPKMRSSIHPVPKRKQETEVAVLSANASKFQADYIVGITPSRPNSKHIVRQPKTVSSALEKRKSKLSRRYSSADIFITGSLKKRASAIPANVSTASNDLISWETPPRTNTPAQTPSKRKSLRNSVILRSAMHQQKHKNVQNISTSTNKCDQILTPNKSFEENDSMESMDNEVVNQTPLEKKKISLPQSCSPRTLRMMQIASRSPTLPKPRRLSLQINKFTFKSADKRRRTENVHLSQSLKSTKKTEVARRRSDFQECLDVEHTESLTDIICNSASCESSFSNSEEESASFTTDQEHTETRQEEEEERNQEKGDQNQILTNFYITKGKIDRRNTNTSFGQSTSTPIHLPYNRRAASESKVIPKFGRMEREENINVKNINEENVNEENVNEQNSDRSLIEGLFELSRNASNIEQSPPKSPRTLQRISTNRQLLINAIFGKHNSTLSGSPIFRKASTSFQENENKESYTPQYEDISMDDKTDKLEISGIEQIDSLSEIPPDPFLFNVPSQSSPNHSEDNNVLISNKSPLNDLSNVEGVKDTFRNSPINDLRNIPSLKRLFKATSPVNDLRNVQGVRKLFKQRNTPRNDLTNVEGVKEILQRRSVYNNISDTAGVKQLFEQRSPRNNLDDVTGVNKLFKRQNTPTNDLTNVEGVKDVLRRRTVYSNFSEVAGVKQLFEQCTPNNNLVDVEGVGNVFKRQNTPRNDLTDVDGGKRMLEIHTPKNNLENVNSITKLYCNEKMEETPDTSATREFNQENLFRTPKIKPSNKTVTTGIKDLFDQSEDEDEIVPKGRPSQDTFDALIGRPYYKTYKAKLNFESPDDSKCKVMNDSMTEAFESRKKRRKISKSLRTSLKEDGEKSFLNTSADIFRVKSDSDSMFITPSIEKTSTPILKTEKRQKRNLVGKNKDKENEETNAIDIEGNEEKLRKPRNKRGIVEVDVSLNDINSNSAKRNKNIFKENVEEHNIDESKINTPTLRRTRRAQQKMKEDYTPQEHGDTKLVEDIDEANKDKSLQRPRKGLQKQINETHEDVKTEEIIDAIRRTKTPVKRTRKRSSQKMINESYETIDDISKDKAPVKGTRRILRKLKNGTETDQNISDINTTNTPVKTTRNVSSQKKKEVSTAQTEEKTNTEENVDNINKQKTPGKRTKRSLRKLKDDDNIKYESTTQPLEETVKDENNGDIDKEKVPIRKTKRDVQKHTKDETDEDFKMDENIEKVNKEKTPVKRTRKDLRKLKDDNIQDETITQTLEKTERDENSGDIDKEKVPIRKTKRDLQKHTKDETDEEIKTDENINEVNKEKTPVKRTRRDLRKLKDEKIKDESITQPLEETKPAETINKEKAPVRRTRRNLQKLADETHEDTETAKNDNIKTTNTPAKRTRNISSKKIKDENTTQTVGETKTVESSDENDKKKARRNKRDLQKPTKDETDEEPKTDDNVDEIKPTKAPNKRTRKGIQNLKDLTRDDISTNETVDDIQTPKISPIKKTRKALSQKLNEENNDTKSDENVVSIKTDKTPVKRTRRAAQNVNAPIRKTKKDLQKHTKDETDEESKIEENIDEIKSEKKSSVKRPRRGLQKLKDEADEEIKMDNNDNVSKTEKTPARKTRKGAQTHARALKNLKDDNVENAKDISKEEENMPVKSRSTRRKDNKENDNSNDMEKEDVILSGSSKDEEVVNKRTRNVAKNAKKGEAKKVDEKKKEEQIPIRSSRRNAGKVTRYN